MEFLASCSQYSPPTFREGIKVSTEEFGSLATSESLFAWIDVPLSQETIGNTQSSGTDGSLTLQLSPGGGDVAKWDL